MEQEGSNLFTAGIQERDVPPVQSSNGPGLTRRIERQSQEGGLGVARPIAWLDSRKFARGFDINKGLGSSSKYTAYSPNKIRPSEAGYMFTNLLRTFDIDRAEEGDIVTFTKGLLFCYTLNSGSQLTPAGAGFVACGRDFQWSSVQNYLSTNLRRFFRAYADENAAVNQEVLDNPNVSDPEVAEQQAALRKVAAERNLHRFPRFAHDTSDHCTNLTLAEYIAINGARTFHISTTFNAVDAARPESHVQSLDNYDSTNYEQVAGSNRPSRSGRAQ